MGEGCQSGEYQAELSPVFILVMAGLDPAIHVLTVKKDVDARHKLGHDDLDFSTFT